jgi:hypothetical protein
VPPDIEGAQEEIYSDMICRVDSVDNGKKIVQYYCAIEGRFNIFK